MRATWTIVSLAALALGCGGSKDDRGATTRASDAGAIAPTSDAAAAIVADAAGPSLGALAGHVPRAPGAMTLGAVRPPAAVIVVTSDGYLVKPGASWAALGALDLATGTGAEHPRALAPPVLELLVAGAGPTAAVARAYQEAIAAEGIGTIGHGSGGGFGGSDDVDVTLTYLVDADDALPLTTPLLVVAPDVPASRTVGALDRVGGVLAVDAGGALQALRLAAPWGDPGWGGAPVPDEEEAYDAWVSRGGLIIDAGSDFAMRRLQFVDGVIDAEIVKASLDNYRGTLASGAEPVVDVLVAGDATTQDLIDALAALHAAGARRIGVGVAPWPMPAFGLDGTPSIGPIGRGSGSGGSHGLAHGAAPKLTLQTVETAGALDKAIVRRYLKRVFPKLSYCYEKELLAKPAIAGTLRLQFTIAEAGQVTGTTATGFDADVTRCVDDVIKAIAFPKPKQGVVQATVVLQMRPSGG